MRSPSELEVVDNASGDLRAMIGEDRGVSKSSKDKGLVSGLKIFLEDLTLSSSEVTEGPLEVAVEDETELSTEAKELVSDLVGLPPTFGFCGGGLGGGALGLDGLVVAIEAGLLMLVFLGATESDLEGTVVSEEVLEGLCRLGMMGGGCGALFFFGEILPAFELRTLAFSRINCELMTIAFSRINSEALVDTEVGDIRSLVSVPMNFVEVGDVSLLDIFEAVEVEVKVENEFLAVVSVGVASAARQTGKKLPFISTFVCKIGPEMSNLLIGPRSGLGGG